MIATNPNDIKRFAQVLAVLFSTRSKDLTDAVQDAWWMALEEYPIDDIERAARTYIKNNDVGKYPPIPATIAGVIDGDGESRALMAWTSVLTAIKRVGAHNSIVFTDPAIMTIIHDFGGWVKLCSMTEDDLKYFGKGEFSKLYRAYLINPPTDVPTMLTGIAQAHNGKIGHAIGYDVAIVDGRKTYLPHNQGYQDLIYQIDGLLALVGGNEQKQLPAPDVS